MQACYTAFLFASTKPDFHRFPLSDHVSASNLFTVHFACFDWEFHSSLVIMIHSSFQPSLTFNPLLLHHGAYLIKHTFKRNRLDCFTFWENFLKKIEEIVSFWPIFQKDLQTHRSIFSGLDENRNCFLKYWKNPESFDEHSREKLNFYLFGG